MDKFSSTGRRGKGKAAHISNVIAEGEVASGDITRDGEIGKAGLGAQGATEVDIRSDWERLVGALVAIKSRNSSAAMAFHPAPPEDLILTQTGCVRVICGTIGYVLNTGERITL